MEKKDGVWEVYNSTGQLRIKRTYKDGKKEGVEEWYDKNGQLWMKRTYKDGKLIEKEYTNTYIIDCTGDAVVGDEVKFKRAVFVGSYPNSKFSHDETIEALVISESYGKQKQQHTFTLLLPNGKKTRIKGRNLYRNELFRKPWFDESKRVEALQEKHQRNDLARTERIIRKEYA